MRLPCAQSGMIVSCEIPKMNSKAQSYNLVFVTEFNGPSEPKTTAVRYNEVPQHSLAG